MNSMKTQRGQSIIPVIFLIVVVAFLGVIVVSLFATQSTQSLGEMFSTQALYIGDGGVEYALITGTFPNYSYPPYSTRGATPNIALGQGNFVVDPPTVLTAAIGSSDLTIPVVSTSGFPGSGMIRIELELIRYDSVTPTSFVLNNPGRRGQAGTTAAAHSLDDAVYSATTLGGGALPNNCTALASVTVNFDPTRFLSSGVFKIDSEYFHYTGTTTTSFTTVTRCFKGSTSAIHTPNTAVYQQWITSTGTVQSGGDTFQRVVRVTVDQ